MCEVEKFVIVSESTFEFPVLLIQSGNSINIRVGGWGGGGEIEGEEESGLCVDACCPVLLSV